MSTALATWLGAISYIDKQAYNLAKLPARS